MHNVLKLEDIQPSLEHFAKQHFGVDAGTLSEAKLDEAIATLRAQLAEKLAIRSDGNGMAMFIPTFEQVKSWHTMFPHVNFDSLQGVVDRAQMTMTTQHMPIIAFIGQAMSRTDLPTAVYQTHPMYSYKVHFGPSVFYLENIRGQADLQTNSMFLEELVNWCSNNVGRFGPGTLEMPYSTTNGEYGSSFNGSHPHCSDSSSNNLHSLCVGNNRFKDYLYGQAPMKNIVDMNSFMVLMNHWCQGANLSDMYGRPASILLTHNAGYTELSAPDEEGRAWHKLTTLLVREASTLLESIAPIVQTLREASVIWQYNGCPPVDMSAELRTMMSAVVSAVGSSALFKFTQESLRAPHNYLGNKEYRVTPEFDHKEENNLTVSITRGSHKFLYLPGMGVLRHLRDTFDTLNQYREACTSSRAMGDVPAMLLEGVVGNIMHIQQKAYVCWMNLNSRRLAADYRNIHHVGHMTGSQFFQNALRADTCISARAERATSRLYWATPDLRAYAAMPKNWQRLAEASGTAVPIPPYVTALV